MKTQPSTDAAATVPGGGLRKFLYATAMITGGAIMIVEILGAKLLAPYFGTSHFVWTAQITVTLLALAAGYAVGGWRADRSQRLRWIYGAILLAALWLALVTLTDAVFWLFFAQKDSIYWIGNMNLTYTVYCILACVMAGSLLGMRRAITPYLLKRPER